MAARTRSQSGALGPLAVLKVAVCVFVIASVALGYVSKKNQLIQLGREITAREAQLDQLMRENRWRSIRLQDLLLPQKLTERVQQLQLGLVPVPQTQWVKLPEPDSQNPGSVSGAHLFVGK